MRISSYSFILILLKLHRCFGDGLKICMWFGYNPQIIFYHFFCYFNLGIFLAFLLAGDINSLNLLVCFSYKLGSSEQGCSDELGNMFTVPTPKSMWRQISKVRYTGFPQALEIMENLENHEKKFHA